jgi:multimeric flavodoxin WrbA
MKVVGFNGSPRKDGNTAILMNHLFRELKKEGIETELVSLSEKELQGCMGCYRCFENKDRRCAVKKDAANECIEKITNADGIVLGSPAHFIDVTPKMKALIDRTGFVALANDRMYRNKIGASLVPFRRSGAMHTVDSMNHFFLSMEIIIAGRGIVVGREKGEVEKDEEGMKIVENLGKRMAWILKKVHG